MPKPLEWPKSRIKRASLDLVPSPLRKLIIAATCIALVGAGTTLAIASTGGTTAPKNAAGTQYGGAQGCTLGFWKTKPTLWENYSTGEYFNEVFGVGPHITLLNALSASGGVEQALERQAVAALLNSSHEYIDYKLSTAEIIKLVQNAYGTKEYEAAKNELAGYNEPSYATCSIDAHGNPTG